MTATSIRYRKSGNSRATERFTVFDGALSVLLFTLTVVPREKVVVPTPTAGLEIARYGLSISPYMLMVFGAAALVLPIALVSERRLVPWGLWVFVGLTSLFAIAVWPFDLYRLSGVMHVVGAVIAWFAAAWLATRVVGRTAGMRCLAWTILAIVGLQVIATVAQKSGISVNPMDAQTAEFMQGRTNGLMSHPANLGKNLFLLMIICLGLIPVAVGGTRRVLWVAVLLSLVPLGLSESRANIIAVLALLLIWPFLNDPSRLRPIRRARVLIPLALIAVSIPFAGQVVQRFQSDPEGGDRPELTQVGLHQIATAPIDGTGPNAYVLVVAEFNDLAKDLHYPVHNVFLLTAAEFGVPLALVFWVGVGAPFVLAWRRRRSRGVTGAFARALLASTPGFVVILYTGWGMLGLSVLQLWFVTLGFAYGAMRVSERPHYVRG